MNTPHISLLGLALSAALMLSACAPSEVDLTLFEDVTPRSGLAAYEGMTHGAAWGDYDGDGKPDLYVTNHLKPAVLFRNLGGGRFEDVTAAVLGAQTGGDKHGAAWADFDNDGDQDLAQLTGAIQGLGEEPKRLFVNDAGILADRARSLGVDNLPGRTRMPLWVDLDGDGKLDLFQGAEARHDAMTPPFFFASQGGSFADMTAWLPLLSRGAPFCVLTSLNDDPHPEIVCRLMGEGTPSQVFDTRTRPAQTLDLLPKTAFEDVAVGDFDNDGRIDLFLARKNPGGPVSLASGGRNVLTAQAELLPKHAGKPLAFRFRAQGPVRFTLAGQHGGDLGAADVRIGGAATAPAGLDITLAPESATGMPKPGADPMRPSVLIGSPEAGVWQVEFHIRAEAFGGKKKPRNLSVRVQADAGLDKVESVGEAAADETAPQRLFMNRDGKLVEEGENRGVNARPVAAANAVAVDFDNDMDLDLFVLGTNDAGKTENLLLLNDGKGRFTPVRQAGWRGGRPVRGGGLRHHGGRGRGRLPGPAHRQRRQHGPQPGAAFGQRPLPGVPQPLRHRQPLAHDRPGGHPLQPGRHRRPGGGGSGRREADPLAGRRRPRAGPEPRTPAFRLGQTRQGGQDHRVLAQRPGAELGQHGIESSHSS
jgi:hypothetical protein